MNARDFILIASVIASLDLSDTDRRATATAFASRIATTNPRFDRDRFMKACGVV